MDFTWNLTAWRELQSTLPRHGAPILTEGRGGKANGPVAWAPRPHTTPQSELQASPVPAGTQPTPSSSPCPGPLHSHDSQNTELGVTGTAAWGTEVRTCPGRAQTGTMTKVSTRATSQPAGDQRHWHLGEAGLCEAQLLGLAPPQGWEWEPHQAWLSLGGLATDAQVGPGHLRSTELGPYACANTGHHGPKKPAGTSALFHSGNLSPALEQT